MASPKAGSRYRCDAYSQTAVTLVVQLAQASYKADLSSPSTRVRNDGLSLQLEIFAMQTCHRGIIGAWPCMHCGQRVGRPKE
jgi:hypothetical protein